MQYIFSKLLLTLVFFMPILTIGLNEKNKHPLHLSSTEINFNEKENSLEISCKLFTDDFEDVLAKQYKIKTDLTKPSMQKAMDDVIEKYLSTHLQFKVNGKKIQATYLGFEKDNEATNVYLEINMVPSIQNLNISNSILYDLFNDQMNILHVTKSGTRKSLRTNYPETNMSVNF